MKRVDCVVIAGSLKPDKVGIRPKLVPAGTPGADCQIDDQSRYGARGLVNLFGIESPGPRQRWRLQTMCCSAPDSYALFAQ